MRSDPVSAWASAVPRLEHTVKAAAPDDPAEAAVRLAGAGLAEEYAVYERAGTWYFAAGPGATLTVDSRLLRMTADGHAWTTPTAGEPLARVARAVHALEYPSWRCHGWAAFELAHLLHGDAAAAGTEPLLHLMFPLVDVELTPGRARIRGATPAWVHRVPDLLAPPGATSAAAEPALPATEFSLSSAEFSVPAADPKPYHRAVAHTVDDIRDRRLEKAVLSRVVPLPDEPELDLITSYLTGRRGNTPARSFLLDTGGWRAAGFSPETVVEVDSDGRVRTQPLAGTRAFGPDATENLRLREELLGDAKEVHEHAISVRLAVDEIGAICQGGSVAVTEFMSVQERGSVQHLASRVTGRLRDGENAWTALAALFPAVTVTGAPKPAALRVIRSRESEPRGLYGGAVLMAEGDGSLDAALALRTVFQRGGRSWLRAGAGVMSQSVPDREWEETCEKLRSIAPHLRARRTTRRTHPPIDKDLS
ncbi:salicylate synthase [Phytoactinopolyspora halotolerans]|uniref:Salicylate synthase n=1 Tax=Phytoactinopolyspora halotolerans TaxID=1981512 RepID=A0A6L9SCH7_9ACTN|nr:salicylate synthase [Phytoactinopolyspora halotolerans]NEE02719.1 salicylate synthase [Phytoactinopolyspora halotolerans]